MHNIYIRARKQWMKLPFVATDDMIFTVLETWPLEWCALDMEELEKAIARKKKDDAKLCVTQLAIKGEMKK